MLLSGLLMKRCRHKMNLLRSPNKGGRTDGEFSPKKEEIMIMSDGEGRRKVN